MDNMDMPRGMDSKEFFQIFEYLIENGSNEDKAKFVEVCEQSAEEGNLHMAAFSGFIYAETDFVKHDYDKAYKFLKFAADNGDKTVEKHLNNSLTIGDRHLVIFDDTRKFMAVYAWLYKEMMESRNALKVNFASIKSCAEFFPKENDYYPNDGFTIYSSMLESFCKYSISEILNALKVNWITGEEIYCTVFDNPQMSADEILPGIKMWVQASNNLKKIKIKYEQHKKEMESRPSSYGTFIGGGRGIIGGLTGALKASLVNMAIDAAAGAVNQASDNKLLTDINNEITKTYNTVMKNYSDMFVFDCRIFMNLTLGMLIERNVLSNFDFKTAIPKETLNKILEDGKNNSESYKLALDKIGEVIQFRPYNPELYAALCRFAPEYENDVLEFMRKNKMEVAFLLAMDREFDYNYLEHQKFILD